MIAFSDIFTFSRASIKWVQDAAGNLVEVAVDEPAFDYSTGKRALLLERQSTNYCNHYNARPIDTTGVSLSGASEGVLSLVDDSAEIEAAGLSGLCNGQVYKLDNTLGESNLFAFLGSAAGLEYTTISAYIRGECSFVAAGQLVSNGIDSSIYQRESFTMFPDGSRTIGIRCNPGKLAYFILAQIEDGSFSTSVLVTKGSSTTRAADICYAENLVGVESGYSIVFSGQLGGVQDRFDRLFQLDNNDNDNRQLLFWQTSVNELRIQLFVDNVNQAASTLGGARTLGVDFRAAYRVGINDFQAAADGVAYDASDTLGYTVPTFMALAAAHAVGTAKPASLSIYSIEILDTLLTEAELIEVTS
jgi:hypothetical protein